MGRDRSSRVIRAASFPLLLLLAPFSSGACAQSVEGTDPFFGEGDGATASADGGSRPIGSRDASVSAPDTSTGGGGVDASLPPADTGVAPNDASGSGGGGGGAADTGGGGPVTPTACPNSPIYAAEGVLELTAANPRLCANGCAATECCYAGLVCVNL